jgi:hypothetical protein
LTAYELGSRVDPLERCRSWKLGWSGGASLNGGARAILSGDGLGGGVAALALVLESLHPSQQIQFLKEGVLLVVRALIFLFLSILLRTLSQVAHRAGGENVLGWKWIASYRYNL